MDDLIEKIKIKAVKDRLKPGWQKRISEELGINKVQLSYALNGQRTDQASYDILEKVYTQLTQ